MLIPALFGYLSVLAVMLPMMLYCFGAAMTFANAFAGAFAFFGHIAGFAGSLFGCVQVGGSGIISALLSWIAVRNQIPLAIFLTAIGIAAYISQCMAFKHFKRRVGD